MQTPAPPAQAQDPRADAIARAERRREWLEELGETAMQIARRAGERALEADEDEAEPAAAAFAAASRTVRLTLALESATEKELLALRNPASPRVGAAAPPWALSPPFPASAAPSAPKTDWTDIVFAPTDDPVRRRLREEVWHVVDQSGLDEARSDLALIRLHERLIERDHEAERYDRLAALPFREAVAAICEDLGLAPDWSRWSDARGFERDHPDLDFIEGRGWTSMDAAAEDARDALVERWRRRAGDAPLKSRRVALE